MITYRGLVLLFSLAILQVSCQLPDDIQRELNQNLAEQARIQAARQQHQNGIQNRVGTSNVRQTAPIVHDPNNYSYQEVSPPIQYSYYQPYGDAAQKPAPGAQTPASIQPPASPVNFDLNNLNFDLPKPQAQTAAAAQPSQHFTPSFTGAGGLPVLQPTANIASNQGSYVPVGNPPLAPQARVQQGPPLTEADFKDITAGENYGASGGDFGLDNAAANVGGPQNSRADNSDAQLREFGFPSGQANSNKRSGEMSDQMNIPDLGSFNMPGDAAPKRRVDNGATSSDGFGFEGLGGGITGGNQAARGGAPAGDFDFASQPSSAQGNQATAAGNAPGSLQSLLGADFPGLGGNGGGGLDGFARNDPQAQLSGQGQQRADDGALDIADMGDKSDQFSGADLGGFEQPSGQNDQDFNYAAASNQQPRSVPYPDGNPQPVGTLWALTQPQSLTQTRYNALPDKGTYQDYPAYASGGNDFSLASQAVDRTPRARRAAPGRYGTPSPGALAPEYRTRDGQSFDYNKGPFYSPGESSYHYE